MTISVTLGDIVGWLVNVTEDGLAKDMTGASLSASVKINGEVHAMSVVPSGASAAFVTIDTTGIPAAGVGAVQCRFALGGQIKTKREDLDIRDTAFA